MLFGWMVIQGRVDSALKSILKSSPGYRELGYSCGGWLHIWRPHEEPCHHGWDSFDMCPAKRDRPRPGVPSCVSSPVDLMDFTQILGLLHLSGPDAAFVGYLGCCIDFIEAVVYYKGDLRWSLFNGLFWGTDWVRIRIGCWKAKVPLTLMRELHLLLQYKGYF